MAVSEAFKKVANSLNTLGVSGLDVFERYQDLDPPMEMEDMLVRGSGMEIVLAEKHIKRVYPYIYHALRRNACGEKQQREDPNLLLSALAVERHFPGYLESFWGSVVAIDRYVTPELTQETMNSFPQLTYEFMNGRPHCRVRDIETWALTPWLSGKQMVVGRLYVGEGNERRIKAGFICDMVMSTDKARVFLTSLTVYTTGEFMWPVFCKDDLSDFVLDTRNFKPSGKRELQIVGHVFGAGNLPGFVVAADMVLHYPWSKMDPFRGTELAWKGGKVLISGKLFDHPKRFFVPYVPDFCRHSYSVEHVKARHLQRKIDFVERGVGCIPPAWMTEIDAIPELRDPYVPKRFTVEYYSVNLVPRMFGLNIPAADVEPTKALWKPVDFTDRMEVRERLTQEDWGKLQKVEFLDNQKVPDGFFFETVEDHGEPVTRDQTSSDSDEDPVLLSPTSAKNDGFWLRRGFLTCRRSEERNGSASGSALKKQLSGSSSGTKQSSADVGTREFKTAKRLMEEKTNKSPTPVFDLTLNESPEAPAAKIAKVEKEKSNADAFKALVKIPKIVADTPRGGLVILKNPPVPVIDLEDEPREKGKFQSQAGKIVHELENRNTGEDAPGTSGQAENDGAAGPHGRTGIMHPDSEKKKLLSQIAALMKRLQEQNISVDELFEAVLDQ